jgi:signal transduction histidine kinase
MYPKFANLNRAERLEKPPPTASVARLRQRAAAGAMVRQGQQERRGVGEAEARQIADQERLRVAREIHDVVGHGLTVINVQAAIALHLISERPDQAEVALAAIKTASKDALEELRGILAVFRQPDASPPRPPVAGLDQLHALVEQMRASGLAVRLEVHGERATVPGAVDLAAYRIVQESLANVLRHAGQAAAMVRVALAPDAITLEIMDNGCGVHGRGDDAGYRHGRGGHGIRGMRERVAALGGTLEAGPREGGGFRVLARLPAGELTSGTVAPTTTRSRSASG